MDLSIGYFIEKTNKNIRRIYTVFFQKRFVSDFLQSLQDLRGHILLLQLWILLLLSQFAVTVVFKNCYCQRMKRQSNRGGFRER